MQSIAVFMVVLALASSASASMFWDNCSSADGTVSTENAEFTVDGEQMDGSVVVKSTVLKRERQNCTLSNSRRVVISYENTVTYEQVQYWHAGELRTANLICERGGNQVPDDDFCE